MKIRYPGPNVPSERRKQAEYIPAFGLALPVGQTIEVPDAQGKALAYTGMVEVVAEVLRPGAGGSERPAAPPKASTKSPGRSLEEEKE